MALGAGISPVATVESAWATLANFFGAWARSMWGGLDNTQTAIRNIRN